jgi:hypothetical protein
MTANCERPEPIKKSQTELENFPNTSSTSTKCYRKPFYRSLVLSCKSNSRKRFFMVFNRKKADKKRIPLKTLSFSMMIIGVFSLLGSER